jgi:hypothetical protein
VKLVGKLKELIQSKLKTVETVQDKREPSIVYTVHAVDPFVFYEILDKMKLLKRGAKPIAPLPTLAQTRELYVALMKEGLEGYEEGIENLIPHMILPLGTTVMRLSGIYFPKIEPPESPKESGDAVQPHPRSA